MWKNGNAHTVGKVQIETNPLEKYPGICGIKMHTYSLTQPIQLLGNNLNKSAYIYKIHVKKATGGGKKSIGLLFEITNDQKPFMHLRTEWANKLNYSQST